ncbi:MAG TPA: GMC family oxidoreductase [Polyangiales bacterium]|nr:GMC family oxidoreductase [Polyangiales bacterium]
MTHVAFQSGARAELEADYVVVGSGAGGATAALTLARGGASVALVEAGPWRDPQDYPHSGYGVLRDLADTWGTSFTRGRAFWPILQSSLVGGTTVINSAICVRTPADVFERWQAETGIDGPALARAVWQAQDELEAELSAVPVPLSARGRHNLLAHAGADKLGYENHAMTRYVRDCQGSGRCLQGCRADRKQSLNRNFVPELLALGGTLVSCAPVQRLQLREGRASGVEGRFKHPQSRQLGAAFQVRARRGVFVAASVTGSPLLLARSGVRNPLLGQGFRSHPGAPVFGCYDEHVDMNRGATQGWSSLAFRQELGLKLETLSMPLDLLAGRLPGSGQQLMERLLDFRHLAMWAVAVRADAVGYVKRGFGGRPVVHYTLTQDDMKRLRAGLYVLAQTHVAAGARAILPAIDGLPYRLAPNEIDRLKDAPLDPRAYVAILSHLFGGCVLGRDRDHSVCDERGRVHGYENLWIADASAIPSTLGVNPQHTIMALARVWARRALEEN